jgi:hypothetical protein
MASKIKKIKDVEKFDKSRMVREIARERIGSVPSSKVINDKKKKDYYNDADCNYNEDDYREGF